MQIQSSLFQVVLFISIRSITVSKRVDVDVLNKLAYLGEFNGVYQFLQQHKEVEWSEFCCFQAKTAVHYALQGRMDAISYNKFSGRHEDVIEALCNLEGYNVSHGCPVYYAGHYRNIPALQLLLNATDRKNSLSCLSSQDSVGLTAVHSSCMNKASGFSRFYASALHSQQIDYNILQVLGLNEAAYLDSSGSDPLQISMSSLLKSINDDDMLTILSFFKNELDLKHVLDSRESTLLHTAAAAGRKSLVRLLVSHGADMGQQNSYGMTALHAACSGGFTDTISELLRLEGAKHIIGIRDNFGRTASDILSIVFGGDPELLEVLDLLNGNYWPRTSFECSLNLHLSARHISAMSAYKDAEKIAVGGGEWFVDKEAVAKSNCDIDRRNSSLTEDEFIRDYYSIKNPVIISGLMQDWPALEKWRKSQLVQRYGHLKVTVSKIPYSSLYGVKNDTAIMTLQKFVSLFPSFQDSTVSGFPPYLFDATLLKSYPDLARDVGTPPLFSKLQVRMQQFVLGPRDSGAPPHFHGTAYNALVYGQKKWFIWKPSDSFFSFDHIKKWLNKEHSLPQVLKSKQCLQNSGDIMFIPENWGHAVINLQPSIAVAMELH